MNDLGGRFPSRRPPGRADDGKRRTVPARRTHPGVSPMPDRRSWQLDLAAAALLAAGFLVALAVLSHDPGTAGPAYPQRPPGDNLLGPARLRHRRPVRFDPPPPPSPPDPDRDPDDEEEDEDASP